MRIGVVGAGITGLSAAWLLGQRHEVVLLEGQARLGGHSNTVEVAAPESVVPVDTGFIVYNEPSYPNLVALFAKLKVPTAATRMTFAVSLDGGGYEYSGTGLTGLFAQKANLLRPYHWQMTADILRFHKEAGALAASGEADLSLGLGDWLVERGYSRAFLERHILPMAAAIWSAPADAMLAFPAASFARFFANHGLLSAYNQPVWRTVVGGSREYVRRLLADSQGQVLTGDPVVRVMREDGGVRVAMQSGRVERFDRVALCCHADEALAILGDASGEERRVLGAFGYSQNEAVLHTDTAWMPKRRAVWSSWNYLAKKTGGPLVVTYWMNSLQPLPTAANYFVTLNPGGGVDPCKVIETFSYAHPMFDRAAMAAQGDIWDLQGKGSVWFGGAYCGYGFHEDGLQAGLAVAEHMTRDIGAVRRPWNVAAESGRMKLQGGIRPRSGAVVEAV